MTLYIDKIVDFLRAMIDPEGKDDLTDEERAMIEKVEENIADAQG